MTELKQEDLEKFSKAIQNLPLEEKKKLIKGLTKEIKEARKRIEKLKENNQN